VGDFSKELCGGIHVTNSGQIGAFKIISETGVAAGIRRIEAITGTNLVARIDETELVLAEAAALLKTSPAGFLNKLSVMTDEMKALRKELDEFKHKAMSTAMDKMIDDAKEMNGVKLITRAFKDYNINDLRKLSDDIKAEYKGLIIVLATENEGKVTFMVSVSDDLLDQGYHAGNMIKQIAAAAGGGGGGKADMAQAGARDASKIKDAFEVAESLLS